LVYWRILLLKTYIMLLKLQYFIEKIEKYYL